MQQIAIIGQTASGKSDLAHEIASKHSAVLLSLDSLAVYKEIDIASAKPSKDQIKGLEYFGLDLLYANEQFDVFAFVDEYKRAYALAKQKEAPLIIVGGSGFYLKMLIEGISQTKIKKEATQPQEQSVAYSRLQAIDKHYAMHIDPNDTYRTQKALQIYESTGMKPTEFFTTHPPKPIIKELKIFEVEIPKEQLRLKVKERTKLMFKTGIVDEVAHLEQKYTREPNCMRAIGIKETLEYLDARIDIYEAEEKIVTNTMRLAKRQRTFNTTQLPPHKVADAQKLKQSILGHTQTML